MTERRIRVAMVITRLNIGGPALHVLLCARHLDHARYDVTVFTGSTGTSEGDMTELIDTSGIRIVRIPGLRRDIAPADDIHALLSLIRAIRKERPEIVHTHMAKAGALGRIAARLSAVHVVLHTFHGNILRGYFGRERSILFAAAERILALISTKVIALGPRQAREILRYGIAPIRKVAEIPLGIELERFRAHSKGSLRSELALNEGTELVGIVARLVPIKGIDVFLDAAALMVAERPRMHFVIVGDGELRAALEARAAAAGLASHAHFIGWRADLPAIYADLDVVLLTSRNEGTPTSLIEAMAASRPVVATAVGGVPDLITEGTGELVPPDRPDLVARSTLALLADRERASVIGRTARERAFREHDAATLVDRMDALYRSLLGPRQAGSVGLAGTSPSDRRAEGDHAGAADKRKGQWTSWHS